MQIIDYIVEMQADEENTYPGAKQVFRESDYLLSKPFNFYGTALQLNTDE